MLTRTGNYFKECETCVQQFETRIEMANPTLLFLILNDAITILPNFKLENQKLIIIVFCYAKLIKTSLYTGF